MKSGMTMKNKGFSLFELVAVVAIIMIVMMISGPYVKGLLEDYRTNEVAIGIYSDFMFAKSEALKRQDDVVIVFDPGEKTYDIVFDNGSDWTPGQVLGSGDFYLKEDVRLPEDYAFASNSYGVYGVDNEGLGLGVTLRSNTVYFQPTGRISDAHEDTLDTLVKQNSRGVYIIRTGDAVRDEYYYLRAIVASGLNGQIQIWKYRGAWVTHD